MPPRVLVALVATLMLTLGSFGSAVSLAPTASAALSTAATGSYPTLKSGASGQNVRTLQYALRHHGRTVSVDGSFGPATRTAVIAFQKAKGLTQDGIVGPRTWAALLSQVQSGSSGELVRAVQSRLGITVDGRFGPNTKAAVVAFQKSKGIKGEGVVGATTWGALLQSGGSSKPGTSTRPTTSTGTGSLVNPYPVAHTCNGCWTKRAAWLRDTIQAKRGMRCTTYVSSSPTSDHRTGNGMDCWGTRQQMYDLSRWVQANASSMKVSYVIFERRIWNIRYPSAGWKWMEDRGTRTKNHYDHVHISVQN